MIEDSCMSSSKVHLPEMCRCPQSCLHCSEFAQKRGMILGTTQQYAPYEKRNVALCVAGRINGIIKYEFGFIKKLPSMEVAQKMIVQAIEIYNHERRHKSLNIKTAA